MKIPIFLGKYHQNGGLHEMFFHLNGRLGNCRGGFLSKRSRWCRGRYHGRSKHLAVGGGRENVGIAEPGMEVLGAFKHKKKLEKKGHQMDLAEKTDCWLEGGGLCRAF